MGMPVMVLGASCDNACSGHGTCGQNGVCTCFDNWGVGLGRVSGDCSERICPFEFAWVDTPDKLGNHHKYAECANRGICDRETGECECFPGYEGKGCARTTCPNDCSGHGRCMEIQDMPFQITPHQYATGDFLSQSAHTFASSYHKWDAEKTRGCVCDPEYGDVDCSKRMCMHGNDIMDQRDDLTDTRLYQTQFIQMVVNTENFESDGITQTDGSDTAAMTSGNTFALTFTRSSMRPSPPSLSSSTSPLAASWTWSRMSSSLLSPCLTRLLMTCTWRGKWPGSILEAKLGSTLPPKRILSPAITLPATQCISTSLSPARTYKDRRIC